MSKQNESGLDFTREQSGQAMEQVKIAATELLRSLRFNTPTDWNVDKCVEALLDHAIDECKTVSEVYLIVAKQLPASNNPNTPAHSRYYALTIVTRALAVSLAALEKDRLLHEEFIRKNGGTVDIF